MDAARKDILALKALKNLRTRLLDLTARNRLINFRHPKNGSLRVIDELPNQLVEMLLNETEMRFLPVPEPSRDKLIEASYIKIDEETKQEIRLRKDPSAAEWGKHLGLSTSYEVPEQSDDDQDVKHADKAIQTLLYPYELETRLKNLRRTAESAIQEMGANILYLGFGFLEWFDVNNGNARIAPLYLIPVRLNKGRLDRKTQTYIYTLSYSGEDLIPNLSLREKLRADFAMVLPKLDETIVPEEYFEEVVALIEKNQPKWSLRRFITLTLLNFSKLLMYLDLDPKHWPEGAGLLEHPVVSRFLAGDVADDENGGNGSGFGEEYRIDEIEDVHAKYPLIDDADSSQHSALIDAVDGKNLVIEGPPGTGKSQTITNLIAAALAQGKRVLFVAEKLAALEVVKRRLDLAGLGVFCLELHSHKSQKRKVLDEVENRLSKHHYYRDPEEIDVDIARYEEHKTTLNKYAELINQPWKKTGKTLHEIFMAATRYREAISINPDRVHLDGEDGDSLDVATQRRTEDQVEAFRKVYQAVARQLDNATLQEHPWFGARNSDLQIFDLERVINTLEDWQDSLQELNETRGKISKELGCDQNKITESLSELILLLEDLQRLPVLKGDELLDRLVVLKGEKLQTAQQFYKLFNDIQTLYAALAKRIGIEALKDLSVAEDFLAAQEKLQQLVSRNIVLGELGHAVEQLTTIRNQLTEFGDAVEEIRATLGNRIAEHLLPTETGFTEFSIFIELVCELSPGDWKLRDDLFDNDELDLLLPELRQELEQLREWNDELSKVFNLDTLPDGAEIRQLKKTLELGGVFRWFKGSWRAARKQLLDRITDSQINFSDAEGLLGKVAKYADARPKFDTNQRYKDALGERLQGLDTDLPALETLRGWYKKVRKQYGIGFGPKVAVGDAVLDLPASLARGIRSLSERGAQKKLSKLLSDLNELKKIFAPVAELQNGTTPLVGEDGILTSIQTSADNAIRAHGPLVTGNDLTTKELAKYVRAFDALRKLVNKWKSSDFDKKLFQGRLGLKIGVNLDNTASLAVFRNTLAAATCLEQQITTKKIRQHIFSQPTAQTFNSLSVLSKQLATALETQTTKHNSFATLVGLDDNDWTQQSGDQVEALVKRNSLAISNGNSLQNWLDYVRIREQMTAMGLIKLTECVENGEIDITQVEDAHKAGIFDLLAREVLREFPKELGRFSGHLQEAIQDKFTEYDNQLKKLQCERIAWKIDQTEVPAGNCYGRVSSYTDRCLLVQECGKKMRHIPLRQLLHRAGNALVALKPCFMMGPMSVAQYLEPGLIKFDLVVMDEASQIKPQDALGAIARGSQLVVVGDPKQLPPTSFFERVVDDEEDDPTAIEESESILDATLPMFSTRRLLWHYRSQHESLIAFSNHAFYKGELVLFPSPYKKTDNFGIQYSRVPHGCFVNRRNMEEAKIISEAVREHFRHRPKESLGVVAMSAEQRLHLEREIEMLAKEDPVFQGWLDKDSLKQEPLFVKNLENVQGDQRDVIFISMTYGPHVPGGKVHRRFGPINSDMGWRRLNVLFTRSKKRMHIFSSMGAEDVVASSTSKRGVHALRDFLNFCETGILHETEVITGKAPDSDFEIAVMDALRDEGFECIPQVGVAGFFIDLAVVDPGNPGRYLMGVECDGATYHSAKSARDRDRLRQTILERLGWRIRRIWSTDWFKNPHSELQPIIQELHELKTEKVEVATPKVESETEEIEQIIEEVEKEEVVTESYQFEGSELKEKLLEFDREVIKKANVVIPDNKRLLRPAMLEAFLEYLPCSKSDFLELMPYYLRQATSPAEGQFLGKILELINTEVGETYD